MTINTYLNMTLNSKAQSTQDCWQFLGLRGRHIFLTCGVSRRVQVTISKNRRLGPPWPGGRLLSCRCLCKSKNCVGLRGGCITFSFGVAVGYLYSIISLVPKYEENDVNEPLVIAFTLSCKPEVENKVTTVTFMFGHSCFTRVYIPNFPFTI